MPANEKITLGVIGVGMMMGGYHLPNFVKDADLKVVAVCDVDTTRRNAARNGSTRNTKHRCARYNDFREIMARKDVHAVACAHARSLARHHHPRSLQGRQRHVLREAADQQPYGSQKGDGYGRQLEDCLPDRQPAAGGQEFRYACEFVRNGRIGKIKQVLVSVGGPPSPCKLPGEDLEAGLDWDRWLGPAPCGPQFGVEPARRTQPFPVVAGVLRIRRRRHDRLGRPSLRHRPMGPGHGQVGPGGNRAAEGRKSGHGVKFIYANGVEVVHGGPFGITFIGEKGEIFVNRGQLASKPHGIIKEPIKDNEIHLYKEPGARGRASAGLDQLHAEPQDSELPRRNRRRTIAVCHLGNIAYLHTEELGGKSLKWDPQKWEFVGNDAANKWKDYPYARRKGYELPEV